MKVHQYSEMMKYLTRPKESEYEQVAMVGNVKKGADLLKKLVKKGKAPKTDVEKVRTQKKAFDETEKELAKSGQIPVKDQTDPSTLSTEDLIEFRKTNRAGKGQFTNAEAIIARLENTIKETSPDDEDYEYVSQTFPNFIKELKAKPELANNENVWNNLMSDLPENQRFVKYDDGTVDFQTKQTTHTFKLREDLDTDRKGPIAPDDDPNMFDDIFNKMYPDYSEGGKYELPLPGEEPLTKKKKRTLNAEGGRIGFDKGGLAKDVQDFLTDAFPNEDLNFKDYKYGVSSAQNRNLYKKIEYIADQRIKKGKDYKYIPSGTDFSELEYEKGYGNADQFVKKAKEKGITISKAKRFAKSFGIDTKKSPYQKSGSDKIYDMTVLDDPEFVEDVIKRQVKTGTSSNKEMIKKYSAEIKYKSEQDIRAGAKKRRLTEKRKQGIPKFKQVEKKYGAEKGHQGDIWSETIKPENIGVVPKKINEALGKKKGIEDQINKLTQKRRKLIKQNPADLKKQLTDINNQLYNLEGKAQGFKQVPFVDPVTKETVFYGGGRFPMDPTGQFEGMTEREARDFRNKYLTEKGKVKPKWLDKDGNFIGSKKDFDNLEKAVIFDQNYEDMKKTVSKQKKALTKSFFNPNQLNMGFGFLDDITTQVMDDVARGAIKYGPDVLRGVGKFGLSEALLGLPGAPFDVAEGRSRDEVLLNIATLGAGVPIKDELERNKYLESIDSGLSKDYQMAKTKQAIASGQARGYEQMNPEFSVLTDREQLALDKADEWTTTVLQPRLQEGIKSFQQYQRGFEEGESGLGLGLYSLGGRVGMKIGGDPKDKKKTTPALDKPTVQIDPNAPVDPAKRDTLKGAGILGAGVALGKLGLLRFAPKIKKAITETTEAAETAPAIVEELYNMIKLKGLGKTTYPPIPERSVETGELLTQKSKQLGNYELTEHPSGGFTIKQVIDTDYRYQVNEFTVYKDKDGKFVYEEISARPDREGKLKDVDYGVDMDTYREIGEDLQRMTKDDQYIKIANESIDQALEDTGMVIDKGILKRNK